MANTSEIKYNAIDVLSGRPISRWLRQWWYRRAEEHYMICAAVEHSRAREAEENEAYYQKRAAMARSAALWD